MAGGRGRIGRRTGCRAPRRGWGTASRTYGSTSFAQGAEHRSHRDSRDRAAHASVPSVPRGRRPEGSDPANRAGSPPAHLDPSAALRRTSRSAGGQVEAATRARARSAPHFSRRQRPADGKIRPVAVVPWCHAGPHERSDGEVDGCSWTHRVPGYQPLRPVGRAGFEPATRGLKAPCSDQAELPPLGPKSTGCGRGDSRS